MAKPLLRPAGFDDLGLRRALGDRMLPLLVAAMAFLGALALAGSVGAAALGRHWRGGAEAMLTVLVPHPGDPAPADPTHADAPRNRRDRAVAVLAGVPGVASARALSETELGDLLRPWLGAGAEQLALPLPALIEIRVGDPAPEFAGLAARLNEAAPGAVVERQDVWVRRLSTLATSLQACAWTILIVVGGVAAAVIALATRAGLVARRDSIEVVHGLGATDGYIASRFARRATRLAAIGGALGALAALPVLLALSGLAAPFGADASAQATVEIDMPLWTRALAAFPPLLWATLPGLPLATCLIGFVTAQTTVRRWLRRLP